MENRKNILPYKFEETQFNSHFKFKKNDITISGTLPHRENKSSSCIIVYETEKEFFGINLNSSHFDRFLNEPIHKVLNGVPMKDQFEGLVFVNFESFFGHFSKENFQNIIEGLTYLTKLYNECKNKVQ